MYICTHSYVYTYSSFAERFERMYEGKLNCLIFCFCRSKN